MTTPTLCGISHLGLTVRDVERSARWYVEVLGFREVGRFATPLGERHKVFLRHEGVPVRLGLVEHAAGTGAPFDETAVGLDHLSFAVANRSELEQWRVHLSEHGVEQSPISDARSVPGALVLVFRDPDGIQLEFFVEH